MAQSNASAVNDDYVYFASESVGEGHPDKLCDQVSDGVLDACLRINPDAKVAMETATKTGMVSAQKYRLFLSLYQRSMASLRPQRTLPTY